MNHKLNIYAKAITLLVIMALPLISFSQQSTIVLPEILTEEDWTKVIITRNPGDVVGLTALPEIEVMSQIPYSGEKKLRTKALDKLKVETAKFKAPIVLIISDEFSYQPLNNVTLKGIPYYKPEKID